MKTCRYTASTAAGYHYAGGFVAPGEHAELSDEEAARGLELGQLVPTQEAKTETPKPSATEENAQ